MYVKEEKEELVAPYRPTRYYQKQEQKKKEQARENAQRRQLQEIAEDKEDKDYYNSSFFYKEPATEAKDNNQINNIDRDTSKDKVATLQNRVGRKQELLQVKSLQQHRTPTKDFVDKSECEEEEEDSQGNLEVSKLAFVKKVLLY